MSEDSIIPPTDLTSASPFEIVPDPVPDQNELDSGADDHSSSFENPVGIDPFEFDGDGGIPGAVRMEGDDLVVALLLSPHPAATIVRKEGAEAREVEGIEAVMFSTDLGKDNNRLMPWRPEDPILAEDEVLYCGQPVAVIVGKNEAACREAREKIKIEYHSAPGILSIDHAMAMQSFHGKQREISRGDSAAVFKKAAPDSTIEGHFAIGAQLPGTRPPGVKINYRPGERAITVELRTESPSMVRAAVAAAFELPESEVSISALPLENSGAAREIESAKLAVLAAVVAKRCRWSVRLRLDGAENALLLGRRHSAHGTYKVHHDDEGKILAADLRIAIDAGFSVGDSDTVLDRAMLHADAAYYIPDFTVRGVLCKTSSVTTANLPGEGVAQGTWMMEEIISRLAIHLEKPVESVREANFYRDNMSENSTHYGQPVSGAAIARVWTQARRRSEFKERSRAIRKWNRKNASFKRGIGMVPMKVGIGDPRSDRNQGTAQVQILNDGSIRVHPGFVDVFDGLMIQVQHDVAVSFGVPLGQVSVFTGNPDATPHMTPRLGVDTTGLVLKAVINACENLQDRLRTVALQMLAARGKMEIELEAIRFEGGFAGVGPAGSDRSLSFSELISGAFRRRVNLTEIGFFRSPNLWWDAEVGAGWPFSGYAYGAAVVEVQIDAFTGEIDVMRVDLVHEGSPAPDQADRDEAQFMRAYAQGQGWLLSEPAPATDNPIDFLCTGEEGMPGLSDAPIQIEIDRLRPMGELSQVPGAPCAEAPIVLAMAAREAVRDAISSFAGRKPVPIDLPVPATPPAILGTLREVSRKITEQEKAKRFEEEAKAVPNTRAPTG